MVDFEKIGSRNTDCGEIGWLVKSKIEETMENRRENKNKLKFKEFLGIDNLDTEQIRTVTEGIDGSFYTGINQDIFTQLEGKKIYLGLFNKNHELIKWKEADIHYLDGFKKSTKSKDRWLITIPKNEMNEHNDWKNVEEK